MELNKIMDSGSNVAVTVSLNDLKDFVSYMFDKSSKKEDQAQPVSHAAETKPTKLLSIEEVMKRLKVSRATLYRWKDANYLVPVKIGRCVRYKLSDIESIEEG